MATNMEYEQENGGRYDEEPRYEGRDRSASPRPTKRDDGYRESRNRSASPNGRMASRDRAPSSRDQREEEGARNTGSNLFVTGIHPRLNEADVTRMFEKYGEVENCSIMKDPHTHESRGFGFVKMVTSDQADAAKGALQGEEIEGRTLSIEKARRARPRTPTPGRYFGPPKRDDFRGPRRDERRGGGYGGSFRDDHYGGSRHDDRRGGGGSYGGRRDDYGSRGIDRYASSRDDRYGGRGDERRGGGSYRDSGRDSYADSGRDSGRDAYPPAEDRYARR